MQHMLQGLSTLDSLGQRQCMRHGEGFCCVWRRPFGGADNVTGGSGGNPHSHIPLRRKPRLSSLLSTCPVSQSLLYTSKSTKSLLLPIHAQLGIITRPKPLKMRPAQRNHTKRSKFEHIQVTGLPDTP